MSLALAPPDAVAVAVVVTGGHAPAQAPVQVDMSPVSFVHRYTALPDPVVRKVPAEDLAVVMTVPPDAPAAALGVDAPALGVDAPALGDDAPAGEAGAAAAALLLPALLHAATVAAAASAPPTPAISLVRLDAGTNLDLTIVLISCAARSPAPASRKSLSVEVRAERRKGLFVDGSSTYDLGHRSTTERAIRLSSVITRAGEGADPRAWGRSSSRCWPRCATRSAC